MNHKNLWNFTTTKQLNQWQIHWAEQLTDFKFKIHYKKDNKNSSTDVLSWWVNYEKVKITHKKILRKNSEKILIKNLITTHYLENVSQTDDKVIRKCHETKVSEHLEVRRTENLIWWKHNFQNYCKKVQQYIAKCNFCQQNKISHNRWYDKVTQLEMSDASWISVTMNFIVKLLLSKNSVWNVTFDSILMIVNQLMKYIMFIFFKKSVMTSILMYIILQELISNHELLKKFIINKDKLFMNKFWKMFTAKLEIKYKLLSAYYSQTDEQSEQMNQTVKTYLHHYVNQKQDNWMQLLLMTQYVYNNTRNKIIKITSFFVNYRHYFKIERQSQAHLIKSQWVMINVIKLKCLYEDLNR